MELTMDMRSEIKKLARLEQTPFPFLSLYLNTKWDDEQQRERIRLFTKNQLKRTYDQFKDREDWQDTFIKDQQQIERYVEGLVRRVYNEEMNGIAIFSCSGAGTFLTYPSIISFQNECFISDLPILRPFVRLSTQYQNTLVVMVDTDSARLFEVSLEGLMAESSIESYVPGRHDQGGWAQMRYQRHIKDHMDKHHKEVAEQLTELFDSGKWKRVVLIGQDRILANFKVFLPERVKQQISDSFSMETDFRAAAPKRKGRRKSSDSSPERKNPSRRLGHVGSEFNTRGFEYRTGSYALPPGFVCPSRGKVSSMWFPCPGSPVR
jgi:peptide chain release factor subunit 1